MSPPHASHYYAAHRGGGLFTETVNQRIASYLCVVAYRLGLAPTILTLANLALGLSTSIVVAVLAPSMADGTVASWLIGLGALLGWQLAYSLDCSDGQLARVTGTASPAGARVDILADVAQQISLVTAVATVAKTYTPGLPTWLIAVFVGTWMVNLVTSALQHGPAAGSLVISNSLPVRLIKLIRDYGAVVALFGVGLAVVPQGTSWLLIAFSCINGSFLFVSIAFAAKTGLRS